MTGTVVDCGSAAERYLRFIEGRCGAYVSAIPTTDVGETGVKAATATGPPVLSLFEVDLGTDVGSAAEHDLLIVLALVLREREGPPKGRVVLRFVTRSAIRSAGRAYGTRWVANDIRIPTPTGLEEVSLLVYGVRRTPRLERVLAAIEEAVETLEIGPDDEYPAVTLAVLERLEVLDGAEGAEIVLGGCGLRFGDRPPAGDVSRDAQYVALVGAAPGTPTIEKLWLQERKLRVGPERGSAKPLEGHPYVLLRFGAQSTQQSVREFVDEIRRRNQRGGGEPTAGVQSESFASFVDRQVEQRRKERIQAMFGHHKMLPVVTPIALEAASNLEVTIGPELMGDIQTSIETVYGPRVPGLRIRFNKQDLPDGTYIIMLDEIPLVSGNVDTRKLLCLARVEQLPRRDSDGNVLSEAKATTIQDGSGRTASWIPIEWGDDVRKAGFETWDAATYVQKHLRAVIVDNLVLFATLEEIERELSAFYGDSPGYARLQLTLQQRALRSGPPRFVEVLHSLLSERLPITPIEPLVQQYLALADKPTVEVAEDMRLVPAVRAHLTRDLVDWRLFVLDEAFEASLREGVICEGEGAILALEPKPTQEMLAAVRKEVQSVWDTGDGMPVVLIVEDCRLRPFVRSLIVLEFPWVRVVARREIEGLINVPFPMARIALAP